MTAGSCRLSPIIFFFFFFGHPGASPRKLSPTSCWVHRRDPVVPPAARCGVPNCCRTAARWRWPGGGHRQNDASCSIPVREGERSVHRPRSPLIIPALAGRESACADQPGPRGDVPRAAASRADGTNRGSCGRAELHSSLLVTVGEHCVRGRAPAARGRGRRSVLIWTERITFVAGKVISTLRSRCTFPRTGAKGRVSFISSSVMPTTISSSAGGRSPAGFLDASFPAGSSWMNWCHVPTYRRSRSFGAAYFPCFGQTARVVLPIYPSGGRVGAVGGGGERLAGDGEHPRDGGAGDVAGHVRTADHEVREVAAAWPLARRTAEPESPGLAAPTQAKASPPSPLPR